MKAIDPENILVDEYGNTVKMSLYLSVDEIKRLQPLMPIKEDENNARY